MQESVLLNKLYVNSHLLFKTKTCLFVIITIFSGKNFPACCCRNSSSPISSNEAEFLCNEAMGSFPKSHSLITFISPVPPGQNDAEACNCSYFLVCNCIWCYCLLFILLLSLKVQNQSTTLRLLHLDAKKDFKAMWPSSWITEATELCLLIPLLSQFCEEQQMSYQKICILTKELKIIKLNLSFWMKKTQKCMFSIAYHSDFPDMQPWREPSSPGRKLTSSDRRRHWYAILTSHQMWSRMVSYAFHIWPGLQNWGDFSDFPDLRSPMGVKMTLDLLSFSSFFFF